MAIDKSKLNKSNNTNQPQSISSIPSANGAYATTADAPSSTITSVSASANAPLTDLVLYHSFEEALDAVNDVKLIPGQVHTEFYIDNNEYHCIVGIGNIVENTPHLILSDSGSSSIAEQFKELER